MNIASKSYYYWQHQYRNRYHTQNKSMHQSTIHNHLWNFCRECNFQHQSSISNCRLRRRMNLFLSKLHSLLPHIWGIGTCLNQDNIHLSTEYILYPNCKICTQSFEMSKENMWKNHPDKTHFCTISMLRFHYNKGSLEGMRNKLSKLLRIHNTHFNIQNRFLLCRVDNLKCWNIFHRPHYLSSILLDRQCMLMNHHKLNSQ